MTTSVTDMCLSHVESRKGSHIQAGAKNSPREPGKGTGKKDSKSWEEEQWDTCRVNEAQSKELRLNAQNDTGQRNCSYNAHQKSFMRTHLFSHPVFFTVVPQAKTLIVAAQKRHRFWPLHFGALSDEPVKKTPVLSTAFQKLPNVKAKANITCPKMSV